MHYRLLGATGISVSIVGIGTWQLGGEWGKDFTQPDVDEIVGAARDRGINLIDTAECYGDHLSEELIGASIQKDRGAWILATKFGHVFRGSFDRSRDFTPAGVVAQLHASLRALRTDYIDLYQMHSATDEEFDTDGLWEALHREKEKGAVRHLGLSISPQTNIVQTRHAPHVGAETIQVVYNRLQREAEERVIPFCREAGLGVLARVPLASGFLSGKYAPGALFPPGDVREVWMKDTRDALLREVQRLQRDEVPAGIPLGQWALAWCLRQPGITCVIPGCKSAQQVRDNAAAVDGID